MWLKNCPRNMLFAVIYALTISAIYCSILSKSVREHLSLFNNENFLTLEDNHFVRSETNEIFTRARSKRDLNDAVIKDKLVTKEWTFQKSANSDITYFKWSESNSSIVFALENTYTVAAHRTTFASSVFYKSTNNGQSFDKVNIDTNPQLRWIKKSPLNPKKFIAGSNKTNTLYTTEDGGVTWKPHTTPGNTYYVVFHPTEENYAFALYWHTRKLYVTTDFAKTWTLVHTGVGFHIFWAVPGVDKDNTTIHFEVLDQHGRTFYRTSSKPYTKINGTLDEIEPASLAVDNQYIFVQRPGERDTSDMLVSYNRGLFSEVLLPNALKADTVEVLSTDDNLVLLSATDGIGHHLYISDESGRYYVTSLRNVYTIIHPYYHYVDRYEVRGSHGTFIVNQIDPATKKVTTKITFNKGVEWVPIQSPDKGCDLSDGCSLHFHLFAKVRELHIYLMESSKHAPGVILMHGISGTFLPDPGTKYNYDEFNVYMTRDGGITWTKVFKGIHDFKILDHGGAIVAVENARNQLSNVIKYTCTEGKTWESHEFTKNPIVISRVVSQTGSTSLWLNLVGRESKKSDWKVINIDFHSLLSKPCNDSDYETWKLKAKYNNNVVTECVLGSTYKYYRRRQDSECMNGRDFDRSIGNGSCECTIYDYHCAYGYEGPSCSRSSWFNEALLTRDCGDTYQLSNGHRKIAGDQCTTDYPFKFKYQILTKPCPIVKPEFLSVTPNALVAQSLEIVNFTVFQRWGTKLKETQYTFDFGDKTQTLIKLGFVDAMVVSHTYRKPGVYTVKLTAVNRAGSASTMCVITIEDTIRNLLIDFPNGRWLNHITTIHATAETQHGRFADLTYFHFVWTFHGTNHSRTSPRKVTFNNSETYLFREKGIHHITLQAVNGVTSMYKDYKVNVYEFVKIVKLTFPLYIQTSSSYVWKIWGKTFLRLLEDKILEICEDDGERVKVEMSLRYGLYAMVYLIGKNADDPFMSKAAKNIVNQVKSPGVTIQYQDTDLQAKIMNAVILQAPSTPGVSKETKHSLIALYIALPVIVAAGFIIFLLVAYYRRRLKSLRRYTILQGNDDEDNHLLGAGDDDDPPLDMNPRTSGDDELLDDHVTGIPGNRPALVLMSGPRNAPLTDHNVII